MIFAAPKIASFNSELASHLDGKNYFSDKAGLYFFVEFFSLAYRIGHVSGNPKAIYTCTTFLLV